MKSSVESPVKQSGHLQFILLAQMLGCFLVIFGHSYPFTVEIPEIFLSIRSFIYCFHMPLFVYCSGFLMAYTDATGSYSFLGFVKNRASRILLPYAVFSSIGLIPKIVFPDLLNQSLELSFLGIVRAFLVPRENVWGHFWFLPMIYILGLLGYFILKFTKQSNKLLAAFISLFIGSALLFVPDLSEWFGLNDIFDYFIFFVLGIFSVSVKGFLEKPKTFYFAPVLLTVALLVFAFFQNSLIARFAIGVLMIFTVITLCIHLQGKITVNKNSLISRTYQIFILSWPCQLITEILLERILKLGFFAVSAAMLTAGIIAPLILLKVVYLFERKTGTHFITKILGG